MGDMRSTLSRPWAQIAGTLLEMGRLYQGQREYIEVLTTMQEAREM